MTCGIRAPRRCPGPRRAAPAKATSEWGLYPGGSQSWNPSQRAFGSKFVTATLKNNGTSRFAMKGSDPQSGSLNTLWDGSLPSAYSPHEEAGRDRARQRGATAASRVAAPTSAPAPSMKAPSSPVEPRQASGRDEHAGFDVGTAGSRVNRLHDPRRGRAGMSAADRTAADSSRLIRSRLEG
jgi:hypothetical protein